MKPRTGAYVLAQAVTIAAVLALVSLPLESATRLGTSTSSSTQQSTSSGYTSEIVLSASSCSSTSRTVTNVLPIGSEAQLVSMVNESFSGHLQHFTSMDTFAVTNDFQDGAEMVWDGNTQGYGGNYTGLRAINGLFEGFLGRTTSMSVTNSTWTITPTGDDSAAVSSSLGFIGHSNIMGFFEFQVQGKDYVEASGQISKEVWNFTSFYAQYTFGTMDVVSFPPESCYP